MKVYRFEKRQKLNANIKEVWEFFSNPQNLPKITPPEMQFEITSPFIDKTYPGQIITYFVRPLMGIKVAWTTEITQLEEGKMFIDEQRFGPYKFWHHQHFFEQTEEGILMTDIIHYALPFNFLSDFLRFFIRINLANFIVEKKLKHIFEFRKNQISKLFEKNSS